MDLKKCKIFIKAVDCGSFSKAAEETFYTPSGISHMMNAFEAEIGFPLLVRSRKGVIPTAEGEKLLPLLRELVRLYEQFGQVTSEIRGLDTGCITIGTYSSVSVHWLPMVIKKFQTDYPNIEIRTMEGIWQELDTWMEQRRVDFCFYSWHPDMKHEWIPLKDDPMLAVLPADHPLAHLNAYPLAACRQEAFIMPALGYDYDVIGIFQEADIQPDIRFSTRDNYAAISMIECGLGMSIMNELITKGRLAKVVMLPLDPPKHITLGIALPALKDASPATAKFISYAERLIK